jgi:hypothetical protein
MPVELEMLGDDGQRLQRPSGRRRPKREPRSGAELLPEREPHPFGLGEAGARQRRVSRIPLHPPGCVEHGLAVARDEEASGVHPRRAQAIAAASIAVAAPRN